MPKVSVIMLVQDNAAHLAEALRSVLEQTFRDFEFLIADDGSTDGSRDVLADFAQADRRIAVQENAASIGPGRSLNALLAVARGEFVARMEADDRCGRERFEALVRALDSAPGTDVVFSDVMLMDGEGREVCPKWRPRSVRGVLRWLPAYPFITHSAVMLRRTVFDRIGGYNERCPVGQDWELWLRLMASGARFEALPRTLLWYRINPAGAGARCGAARPLGPYERAAVCLANRARRRALACLAALPVTQRLQVLARGLVPQGSVLWWMRLRGNVAPGGTVARLHAQGTSPPDTLTAESRNLVERNRRIHDRIAARYETDHVEIYNPTEQARIRNSLRQALDLVRTDTREPEVLDYGSGTGNLTAHLLALGAHVVAADVSPAILAELRRQMDHSGNLRTMVINGTNLELLPDASVDLVATYSVLHHVPDYLGIVSEFARVVKPGGVILIDHEMCPGYWQRDETYLQYWRALHPPRSLIGGVRHKLMRSLSARAWHGLLHRKLERLRSRLDGRPYVSPQGDIHVRPDDHIDWQAIRNRLEPACEILLERDYLVCRETSEPAPIWQAWKDRCTDMRLLLARRIPQPHGQRAGATGDG